MQTGPDTRQEEIARIVAHHLPMTQLRGVVPLTGGVSADVYRLDLRNADGRDEALVLRIHGATHGGHDAALEFKLLEGLHRAGAPVARPLLVDTSTTLCPYPFLVIAHVDGTTALPGDHLASRIAAMAQALAAIHALPLDGLPGLPDRLDPRPELLGWLDEDGSLDPTGDGRKAVAALSETRFTGTPSLLHGDFWPENIIWRDGEIAAVLDWEDAAFGDPLSDVACTCLELRYVFGEQAISLFPSAYVAHRPVDPQRLALWLAYVAAAALRYMGDWGLTAEREARMRREARATLAEAIAALAGKIS